MSHRKLPLYLLLLLIVASCQPKRSKPADRRHSGEIIFRYARNISITRDSNTYRVVLADPWHPGQSLRTYLLLAPGAAQPRNADPATTLRIPLRRSLIFTTVHASLIEMLHVQRAIAGVADAEYMLIPDIRRRLRNPTDSFPIADCGSTLSPNIEKIIDLSPDAIFLSPMENSSDHGRLGQAGIPLIECAEYMESSALARAEWMKFYGLLFGCARQADSLFSLVERSYRRLERKAAQAKITRSVLPDRRTGDVWYMPGGQSSIGRIYKDAHGRYAFAADRHSGSLALPFETVLDKAGQADFWILLHNGPIDRHRLLDEFPGYAALRPMRTGEIYGCRIDRIPYFEEVSWRPDRLLCDLIQLFHPDIRIAPLRYYRRIPSEAKGEKK